MRTLTGTSATTSRPRQRLRKQPGKHPGKQPRKQKVRWQDLSPAYRAGIVVLAAVQIGLAVSAWADLARRDPGEVRGPKWLWALVITQNIIGPLAYFRWGRRPRPEPDHG